MKSILQRFYKAAEVIKMGHPTLRTIAKPFDPKEIKAEETQKLVQTMMQTMRERNGLGLGKKKVKRQRWIKDMSSPLVLMLSIWYSFTAAPQINVAKQLIVLELENPKNMNLQGKKAKPMTALAMFNPKVEVIEKVFNVDSSSCD